jgi:leucyl-tRNA---protein transferase
VHLRIQHPEAVEPDELDRYLSDGWYRVGQSMITCRFVSTKDGGPARGVVWTRTPLSSYRHSKSNRRLMRRNLRRYRVDEGPLVIDDEHEAVYASYLDVAPGERSATLADSLLAGSEHDRFDTQEIALRDEDGRLVAFSAFDVGVEGLQSLMGVYDPAYARDSLGYWTLLLEVEHAIDRGLRYHYAGYVVPADKSMDYKLRIGEVEFLHPDEGQWRPWQEMASLELPAERLERALSEVQQALVARDLPAEVHSYPWFEAPAWGSELGSLLCEPRVVVLGEGPHDAEFLVVIWSLDTGRYEVAQMARATVRAEARDGTRRELEMWMNQGSVDFGEDPEIAAAMVAGCALAID